MGLVLSGGPYIYQTFDGSSKASIIAGIKAALVAANWTATAIAGGWKLTATSSQGLTVDCSVWDAGYGTQVPVQFSSSSNTGYEHRIEKVTGRTYQIVCSPPQMWVSCPGLRGSPIGSVVCGGIPFVPNITGGASACGDIGTGGDAVTELWWSMGDCYGSPFFWASTPRSNLNVHTTAGDLEVHYPQELCFNGTLYDGGSLSNGSHVRIATFAHSYLSTGTGDHIQKWDGSPLIVDPLLCVESTFYGAIWDARTVTLAKPADDTTRVFGSSELPAEFNWINFTDSYFWGSLYLIKGEGASGPAKVNFIY